MKNNNKIQLLVVLMIMVLLSIGPAVAQYNWYGFQLEGNADDPNCAYNGTVASGTVYGGVYIDCGHGADTANPPDGYVQGFSVPSHQNVEFAHLYTGVWHGTENYQGKLKVEYTSATGTQILSATGTDPSGNLTLGGAVDTNDNVWTASHGVTWVWYDVTDLVTAGSNTATGYTHKISSGFDGRIYGFKLVVVYENSSEPEVMYWINQGHDSLSYATSGHPERNSGTAHFDGTITPGDWNYAMVYCTWLTGDAGDNDTLKFNGHILDDSCTNQEQGAYLDSRWYVVDTAYLQPNGNYLEYSRDTDCYAHWVEADLVLFKEEPQPDLTGYSGPVPVDHELVGCPANGPVLPGHDSTHGYVVGHTYEYTVTITNQGKLPSNACSAALNENGNLMQVLPVPALDAGESCILTFTWPSATSGDRTLSVSIDSNGVIVESDESNNVISMVVNVLSNGDPDLAITVDDITFLPTANSNDITVQVTVVNDGTADANNFAVEVKQGTTLLCTIPSMSVAAKADKKASCTFSKSNGGPYTITAILDANGAVTESNEGNNEASKVLNVIEVMLWNSHHHGDTSAYGGVDMFKVTKLVPLHTTPWDALNSVADVTPNPGQTYVYGIDGIDEDARIYWYLYLNGRYVPNNMLCGVIKLLDGETMHWDFQKQIQTAGDTFTPPCTVQSYVAGDDLYPEPFTHGIPMVPGSGTRTVWDTVIVYPAGSSDFQTLADDIKDTLVAGGVPTGKISIAGDTSVTTSQKQNCNLVLIGNYEDNSLISQVNAQHEDIGMPVFFDYPSCTIKEDDDDPTTPTQTYDHGAVVEAFDNPWNEGAHVDHAGSVVFLASGLNDGDAKDAANMLIGGTDELNEFWRVKLAMCGDVDCDGYVTTADVYPVFTRSVCSEWAADVDCDGYVTTADVYPVFARILNCCTGC